MNKILISTFILILAITMACTGRQNSSKNAATKTQLRGVYQVMGFGMQPGKSLDSLNATGVLNFGARPFNFMENDTVVLDPVFGLEYFGDSIFHYSLTDRSLILSNGTKKMELPYVDEGVIRVTVNHRDLERLDLVSAKAIKAL